MAGERSKVKAEDPVPGLVELPKGRPVRPLVTWLVVLRHAPLPPVRGGVRDVPRKFEVEAADEAGTLAAVRELYPVLKDPGCNLANYTITKKE